MHLVSPEIPLCESGRLRMTPNSYAPVDYAYIHSELGKVGVTEILLWEEYCEKCKKEDVNVCSYPTFARGYKKHTVRRNYTSHVEHKPGVTLEVDWSGPMMSYIDPDRNTECTAYLFVAIFSYSQYTYVDAIVKNKAKTARRTAISSKKDRVEKFTAT